MQSASLSVLPKAEKFCSIEPVCKPIMYTKSAFDAIALLWDWATTVPGILTALIRIYNGKNPRRTAHAKSPAYRGPIPCENKASRRVSYRLHSNDRLQFQEVTRLRLKTHGVENRRRFSTPCVFSLRIGLRTKSRYHGRLCKCLFDTELRRTDMCATKTCIQGGSKKSVTYRVIIRAHWKHVNEARFSLKWSVKQQQNIAINMLCMTDLQRR